MQFDNSFTNYFNAFLPFYFCSPPLSPNTTHTDLREVEFINSVMILLALLLLRGRNYDFSLLGVVQRGKISKVSKIVSVCSVCCLQYWPWLQETITRSFGRDRNGTS